MFAGDGGSALTVVNALGYAKPSVVSWCVERPKP
jgi:hypothetical protein